MQRVHKYMTKVKNMLDHMLPKHGGKIGGKVQKLIREKSSRKNGDKKIDSSSLMML